MKGIAFVFCLALLLGACSSSAPAPEKQQAVVATPPPPPPVKDDRALLLTENLQTAMVVHNHLLDKKELPGGTLGQYEANGKKYQMFIIETSSSQDAAILLLDLKNTLTDPEYIAYMGGYTGTDAGKPFYTFASFNTSPELSVSRKTRQTQLHANSQSGSGKLASHLITAGLWLLLVASIAKLWLAQLPSGFWVDEMVTAFVVAHPHDPSFVIAPQVPQSIYYWLPKLAIEIGGMSEAVYRIPSIIAMILALPLFAWLAARLIHPRAAWFAVFVCFGLRGIDYHAADARPYALGMLVSAAALCFLVRWLDNAKWLDALGFVIFASLLWRVHLIYWPFYLVFALYPVLRIRAGETGVTWRDAIAVFAILGVTLIPVALSAITLQRNAHAHVISDIPDFRSLDHEIRWTLVVVCGGAAWLVGRLLGWIAPRRDLPHSALTLIVAWWLLDPVVLFLYSHVTGNSVFIGRYLSIAVPGIAMAATAFAAYFLPDDRWRQASLVLGFFVLLIAGQWRTTWISHEKSDWKGAASDVNELVLSDRTPVIVPSPFIEARTPVWTPDYPLPGFLYSHLPFYPLKGKIYLFPFERKDGTQYAEKLAGADLKSSGRFLIYGGDNNVEYWTNFFAGEPELRDWRHRIDHYGDVLVGVFTGPAPGEAIKSGT